MLTGRGLRFYLATERTNQNLVNISAQGLYELEAKFLINHEWATSAEDIMWRRSKLGLHMSEDERVAFTEWFGAQNS